MIRSIFALALGLFGAALISGAAMAADNGGFGASFTNKAPSALTEAPNSTIAQTSAVPDAIGPDGKALQDIMPAAGDEGEGDSDELPADPEQLSPDTPPVVTTNPDADQ